MSSDSKQDFLPWILICVELSVLVLAILMASVSNHQVSEHLRLMEREIQSMTSSFDLERKKIAAIESAVVVDIEYPKPWYAKYCQDDGLVNLVVSAKSEAEFKIILAAWQYDHPSRRVILVTYDNFFDELPSEDRRVTVMHLPRSYL